MRGNENFIFICKQCQKIYLNCEARAIVEELQQIRIDQDGLQMVEDSEILSTVTKKYLCIKNEYHDIYLVDINDEIFSMIYSKAKDDDGLPFTVSVEETEQTFGKLRYEPQKFMERLFDDSL